MPKTLNEFQPYCLSLLRIVTALVLFSYGTQKILHFPAAENVPAVGSLSWLAVWLDLVCGFLALVGFKSRHAAFILSGLMACAYFIGHFPRGFYPAHNGGVASILCCFTFLYLFVAGGGPLSLDHTMKN